MQLQSAAPVQGPATDTAALQSRIEELQLRLEAAQNGSSAGQTKPAWARWRRVEDFPRDRLLFVSFSNGHYADLMMNWVHTLRVLEVTPRPGLDPGRRSDPVPRVYS